MCGIVGTVNWGDAETLSAMNTLMAHRGPDDAGQWQHFAADGAFIGLGSRRLAIIDLSPAGHMPMCNEDGMVWIVFNGEIYNFAPIRAELCRKGHVFRSNTDTEVIIHLYEEEGPDCVRRLNGMFAFAICDLRGADPLLMLARDHFGIKPLYYTQRGDRLAFASEVKSLLQLPEMSVGIDLEALHQYLTFLWVPDPLTLFRGVYKLPAGHYALFRKGQFGIVRYWDVRFPDRGVAYRLSEGEVIEELRAHFRQAVRSQLISDVPLGAFLSSGLDSSSIVAMMAEVAAEPVRTFTITFPPHYRIGELTLDDPQVAAFVARAFGCNHREIVVEPDVVDLLPRLVWHLDEPVGDPAIIMAYLVSREARRDVKVLLSGVGGDELFAGYRRHYAHHWAQAYRRLPALLRRRLVEPVVYTLPTLRGSALKGWMRLAKKMVRSASLSPQEAFLMNNTFLNDAEKAELYCEAMQAQVANYEPLSTHKAQLGRVANADLLNQFLYLEMKTFMVSLNLTYSDKMSMASSVEVRVPFLDRELVEFVVRNVPPSLKVKGQLRPTTKYIFRQAMRGILPACVLDRPKTSFGAPADYWLSNDLREMVDDLLSEERVRRRGFFEPKAVQKLIREHRNAQQDWSLQIWQLLTLELWMQQFVDVRRTLCPISIPRCA
ncbi:MAG: asparagine synthase (glutamine-hydrolyzing) [Chloroflexaceae bacterium]|nr:asparagine synthase (glutamine-hydrolyzing) [Chloroflexaceae bacterium]